MSTKTITLEMDAYEKLRSSKRPGESFTEVVRRAHFEDGRLTAAQLRNYLRKGGSGVNLDYLKAVDAASQYDPLPDNPWT